MKINKLNTLIILGLVAIIGILIMQLLWTKQAYNLEERKFNQKVNVALLEVAYKIYKNKNYEIPLESPVDKISNDYYVVNIENDFEPNILELYLINEFQKKGINTDFEYAMYNCNSDKMVYGNYISFEDNKKNEYINFPKQNGLVYYFAIRFPNKNTYLLNSLSFWITLSFTLLLILVIYVYSIFTILEQKKYSELQRDFVNNMTHEFKTPLSSILLASNYLINQEQIFNNDKFNKYTEIIINQSKKLNEHIETILNVAKSDYSPLNLELENIKIIEVIEEVLENIKLKHPNINCKIEYDEDYSIRADIFHLKNIINNLIDNSIKYNLNEPIILIKIFKLKPNYICIDLIDNGIGIPKDKLKFIFEKFYRVSELNTSEKGFGLGLYYVKKMIDLHKWKIHVNNNIFEGLKVTLIINTTKNE